MTGSEKVYPLTMHFPKQSCIISENWVTVVIPDVDAFMATLVKHITLEKSIMLTKKADGDDRPEEYDYDKDRRKWE